MALETLKDVKQIGQYPVIVMDELRAKYPEKFNESGAMDYQWFETEIRPFHFIYVRHDKNSLSFTLQQGPVKEVGFNGCQVDTIIEAAKTILEGLPDGSPWNVKGRDYDVPYSIPTTLGPGFVIEGEGAPITPRASLIQAIGAKPLRVEIHFEGSSKGVS